MVRLLALAVSALVVHVQAQLYPNETVAEGLHGLGDCHAYKAEDACTAAHCVWCEAGAVPSSCYTAEEAAQLPPAVFECKKQTVDEAKWHAPVFIGVWPRMEDKHICHYYRTREKCLHRHCYWCKSSAEPSACFNESDAHKLPSDTFECEKPDLSDAGTVDWALTQAPRDAQGWEKLFEQWKQHYKKQYALPMEEQVRRNVFQHNAHLVAAHNARNDRSYTLEINAFADVTWEEFQQLYLGSPQTCSATVADKAEKLQYTSAPKEKDWRKDGVVSPVKNQGKCGSCWSFSSTGCLESHVKLKHGKTVLLSEQNLLDCAQAFDTHGCNGGLPSHAFEYVKYNGGLDTEETYPYEAKQGKCKFNTYHVGAQVEKVVNITARDEHELRGAVGTVGPVSIAFQVVEDFRFYKSGVYASNKCHSGEKDVNHAVLAVGYGKEDGKKHWIVKNSWGAQWGMDGYFMIQRDVNMCGVADCASYPVVK